MGEVLHLLSGQAQFNQALMNFLSFQPYASPNRDLARSSDMLLQQHNFEVDQNSVTQEFFDV